MKAELAKEGIIYSDPLYSGHEDSCDVMPLPAPPKRPATICTCITTHYISYHAHLPAFQLMTAVPWTENNVPAFKFLKKCPWGACSLEPACLSWYADLIVCSFSKLLI